MNRTQTDTKRLRTEFGTFYAHVEYTTKGIPHKVWISVPQKVADAQLGDLLKQVCGTFNAMLK